MDALKSRVVAALQQQFGDRTLSTEYLSILHRGRFANAIVFRYRDASYDLVIKDYSHCPWLLRHTIGRLFIGREAKNLRRLGMLDAVVGASHRATPVMLVYPYVGGMPLKALFREQVALPASFFHQMEQQIHAMHQHNVVHLDLRNLGNVLCRRDAAPQFIDFQSAISLRRVPRRLHNVLKAADLSAVYKAWDALCEEPLPEASREALERFNRLRKGWILRGYPLSGTLNKVRGRLRGLSRPAAFEKQYESTDNIPPAPRHG